MNHIALTAVLEVVPGHVVGLLSGRRGRSIAVARQLGSRGDLADLGTDQSLTVVTNTLTIVLPTWSYDPTCGRSVFR
ncbi:MAG: hypothetical protein IPL37_11210 [Austwickia sp.]|nr:hypothetical protein [Austwickia sp.]